MTLKKKKTENSFSVNITQWFDIGCKIYVNLTRIMLQPQISQLQDNSSFFKNNVLKPVDDNNR